MGPYNIRCVSTTVKHDIGQWRLIYTYDASTSTSISHVWTGTTQVQTHEKGTRACACACVVTVHTWNWKFVLFLFFQELSTKAPATSSSTLLQSSSRNTSLEYRSRVWFRSENCREGLVRTGSAVLMRQTKMCVNFAIFKGDYGNTANVHGVSRYWVWRGQLEILLANCTKWSYCLRGVFQEKRNFIDSYQRV